MAVMVLVTTTACGSSESSEEAKKDDAPAAALPESITNLLEEGFAGTWTAPPSEGPAAAKGKKVWVISCGQVASSCANMANAAMDAGKALGWNMTLFDGKLDPSNYSNGILQAIAADVDGIFAGSIDCAVALGPLTQAKKADITTVSVSGFDCDDDLRKTGDPVYSTYVKYTGIDTYGQTYDRWTEYAAAWIANATNGKAQVVNGFSPGYLVSEHQLRGFNKVIDKCPGCKVVNELGITAADQSGPAAQQKLQQAITQHPEVNAVKLAVSGWFARFGDAALRATGRDLAVAGAECDEPAIAAIKGSGPLDACIHRDLQWESWAAMDAMNRDFADPGSKPVDQGLGFQIIDKDHNLPTGKTYELPIDYQAAYKKVWGGSAS